MNNAAANVPEPYQTWEELAESIRRPIPRSVRVLMADLILAWARVDSSIAQLSGAAFALDATASAIVFRRTSVADRIMKLRELNVQLGRLEQAKVLRALKKDYEAHSRVRNLLAHAACAGMLKANPPRLVFLPFEAEGGFGKLAIEVVPLIELEKSIRWGARLERNIITMLDETGFYADPSACREPKAKSP